MKTGILGTSPAGLYAAILIKRNYPNAEINILDQSTADATWGFGVVFSETVLTFLRLSKVDDSLSEEAKD